MKNRQKNMKKFFEQGIFQNKGVPPMEKVKKYGSRRAHNRPMAYRRGTEV